MREIGIIGLGLVGGALADRLLRSGYAVLGYDLDVNAREALQAAGGHVADTAVEVARQRQVLIFSLPNADVVASVMAEIEPALRSGHLIIDTTTGDPARSLALGESLSRRGISFLDATIAGSSAQVREGQVIVLAGGQSQSFASAREILTTFAQAAFHVGPWGCGTRMKLVVNLVLGLNRAVLAEGLTLATALELDPANTLAILKASPAYSAVMVTKGEKMLARDYQPQARLSQHLKDVHLILDAARRTNIALPLSRVHEELLEQAERAGFGQLDNSAVLEAFSLFKSSTKPAADA